MFIDHTPSNENEEPIKTQVLRNLCYTLTDKIQNNKTYCNYLLNNTPLHEKLLLTINDAIAIHEVEEKYELCALLLNFKITLTNENN
jgi:hypothetical protein